MCKQGFNFSWPESNVYQPLWPNGEGTGLLNQGLWVRVPPGVVSIKFFVSKVVLDGHDAI